MSSYTGKKCFVCKTQLKDPTVAPTALCLTCATDFLKWLATQMRQGVTKTSR
jgi:hypothetical protein